MTTTTATSPAVVSVLDTGFEQAEQSVFSITATAREQDLKSQYVASTILDEAGITGDARTDAITSVLSINNGLRRTAREMYFVGRALSSLKMMFVNDEHFAKLCRKIWGLNSLKVSNLIRGAEYLSAHVDDIENLEKFNGSFFHRIFAEHMSDADIQQVLESATTHQATQLIRQLEDLSRSSAEAQARAETIETDLYHTKEELKAATARLAKEKEQASVAERQRLGMEKHIRRLEEQHRDAQEDITELRKRIREIESQPTPVAEKIVEKVPAGYATKEAALDDIAAQLLQKQKLHAEIEEKIKASRRALAAEQGKDAEYALRVKKIGEMRDGITALAQQFPEVWLARQYDDPKIKVEIEQVAIMLARFAEQLFPSVGEYLSTK